jgi:2-polyprenyl-3-methyl-5-hydroxy-6-metoxy-1,4-benzoquinol methylase
MTNSKYPELVWTSEMVARFWDWQSQFPETYFTYQFGAEIVRVLSPTLGQSRTVLDYGCGTGYLLSHLCQTGKSVWGSDISVASVAAANERLAGTPNFKGASTISDLRAHAITFDAIVVIEVIEHLYDQELDVVLSDIKALLSPSGVAIFTTPNQEDLSRNHIMSPETGRLFHRWQHVRSWNQDSLNDRLRNAGFQPTQIFETNLAAPAADTPWALARKLAKRMIFGAPGKPHLVAVATHSVG